MKKKSKEKRGKEEEKKEKEKNWAGGGKREVKERT